MSIDVVIAAVGIVLTVGIAIYAILDVRNEARKMLTLGRDLAYLSVKHDMLWEFIEPTERANPPALAKSLETFAFLAKKVNPQWTDENIKSAVQNEALEFAEELVSRGSARWKSGFDPARVRKVIAEWQVDKTSERAKKILGHARWLK